MSTTNTQTTLKGNYKKVYKDAPKKKDPKFKKLRDMFKPKK